MTNTFEGDKTNTTLKDNLKQQELKTFSLVSMSLDSLQWLLGLEKYNSVWHH